MSNAQQLEQAWHFIDQQNQHFNQLLTAMGIIITVVIGLNVFWYLHAIKKIKKELQTEFKKSLDEAINKLNKQFDKLSKKQKKTEEKANIQDPKLRDTVINIAENKDQNGDSK